MTAILQRQRRAVLVAAGAALVLPAARAQQPKTHRIEINAFLFVPAILSVRVGDTIVFVNKDLVPHTATAKDASWDTGEIRGGAEIASRFDKAGHFAYFCRYHPAMLGTVEVKA